MVHLRRYLLVMVLIAGFALPVEAQARSLAQLPSLSRLHYQKAALRHAVDVQQWFANRGVSLRPGQRPALNTATYRLWWFTQQTHWLRSEIAETERQIRVQLMGDVNAWLCIHRGEADWHYDKDASGHNRKYDGGLQMDETFQSTYGPPALGYPSWPALLKAKGTADHWTPQEQIIVAQYAKTHGRGYGPWPVTAPNCGLF